MRFTSAISVLLAGAGLAISCGGSTSSTGSSGGASGSGAAGSGGKGATAGTGGSGAAGTGGTGLAGGSGGIGGSSGSGGIPGAWSACTDGSQCLLFAKNCCGGYCTQVPLDSFAALNSAYSDEYQAQYCPSPTNCTDCAYAPMPHYTHVCRAGTCLAVDVRVDSLSACSSDAECVLRWGAECCESCSSQSGLTSISKNAAFGAEVCGNAPACPPCVPPPYPAEAVAFCIGGHCQATIPI